MSQLLKKLERMSGAKMSAIVMSGRPVVSTFNAEQQRLLELSKTTCEQLLTDSEQLHVVTVEDEETASFDEVHMRVNSDYIFGLRLNQRALFISIADSRSDLLRTQTTLRSARRVLNKFVDSVVAQRKNS